MGMKVKRKIEKVKKYRLMIFLQFVFHARAQRKRKVAGRNQGCIILPFL